jgi:glutathione S-transferase
MVPFSQTTGYAPKHLAVLAANPKGQVPVLVDAGLTLTDSTVILEYLEDAYPAPALYPSQPETRALCRQFELYGDEILLVPVRSLMYRNGPQSDDPQRRLAQQSDAKNGEAVLLTHYEKLNSQLIGTDFLFERFCVADLAVFLPLLYAKRLGGPSLAGHEQVSAWFDRLAARPAFAGVIDEIATADKKLSWPLAP